MMQPAEEEKQPLMPEEPAPPGGQAPGTPGGQGEVPAPETGTEPRPAAETKTDGSSGGPAEKPGKSALRETLETVVVALLIALLIRSFLVQLYVVDGESMFPTLHHGDRLLVSKIGYRIGSPQVGDIVVLEDPQNPRRQLIKRVIAVGGETVEIRHRTVFVDGKPLAETFTNPVSIHFNDLRPTPVPEGHVFVMGDNRGGSLDSRALGAIPVSKLEGKAFFMFWPLPRWGQGPLDQPRQYIQ